MYRKKPGCCSWCPSLSKDVRPTPICLSWKTQHFECGRSKGSMKDIRTTSEPRHSMPYVPTLVWFWGVNGAAYIPYSIPYMECLRKLFRPFSETSSFDPGRWTRTTIVAPGLVQHQILEIRSRKEVNTDLCVIKSICEFQSCRSPQGYSSRVYIEQSPIP